MAFGEELILRTKLQPPRLRRWMLARPRLYTRLEEGLDYRLTVLAAPTGYGKSTLLAGWLAGSAHSYAWYNVGTLDADPFIFLLHLVYAFHDRFNGLGDRALQALEREWNEAATSAERRAASRPALHLFINELCNSLTQDTFLILDDFHLLEAHRPTLAVAEEFIAAAPPNLHIIIASRHRPAFEQYSHWQVKQELLLLEKETLAFTPVETARLFEDRYGYRLTEEQAARLSTETEGWIIALQMVWQNLQSAEPIQLETRNQKLETNLDPILRDLPRTLTGLFDYLAQEVLSRQETQVQRFLLESSVLRRMTGPACDFVLELPAGQGEAMLRRLSEAGLFIIVQGDETSTKATPSYRYHHLFGEFLASRLQATSDRANLLHHRAARFFEQRCQPQEAIYHYLAAEDWAAAGHLLESGLGQKLLETGQLERLEQWLSTIPPQILAHYPALLVLKGDYLRLTSRFELALQSYRQAARLEESRESQAEAKAALIPRDPPLEARALRGLALVYLDTVQPTAAEEWLERALEVAEKTSDIPLRATLLRDLAENKLNRGRPLEAEELHRRARELLQLPDNGSPDDVRILLRSGRINEASAFLEQNLELEERGEKREEENSGPLIADEAENVNRKAPTGYAAGSRKAFHRAGRSHREGLLVLALLDASRGEGERAVLRAEQGIFLARELRTPFTEAVAWQRLGHALNVAGKFEQALEAYDKAQALGDQLQVRRLRAEGSMGRCLLFGRYPEGNLGLARRAADEGIQVARRAGDEWIEGFLQLSLTAALVEHGELAEASSVVQTAQALLENCGDRFGLTLARLWAALAGADPAEIKAAIQACRAEDYPFLIERPTLFGPKNPEIFQKLTQIEEKEPKAGKPLPTAEEGSHATLRLTYNSSQSNAATLTIPSTIHHSPSTIHHPPSTTLEITTLGQFRVRRPDGSELGPRDWQREKARQLFQLLLTRRDKPLPKEQILEYLWPESDPTAADTNFKVVLNALVRALEPSRSSRSQSSYIIRSGSGAGLAYALNSTSGQIWLDAAEFERLANQGAHLELTLSTNPPPEAEAATLDCYSRALELYRGDFLPGCLYEDWAAPERERLLTLFLTTAERLTHLLTARGEWERSLAVCRLILARDNCWEEAYRLMMLAYWKQGHRAAALRTYEKCLAALSQELGIEPMPQTLKLYQEILLD